jgi:hypothetical protein
MKGVDMRKIRMMALAMGLVFTALQASNGMAADTTCEDKCYEEYRACQIFCSTTPCFVPCEIPLRICLNNCGSES